MSLGSIAISVIVGIFMGLILAWIIRAIGERHQELQSLDLNQPDDDFIIPVSREHVGR